MCDFGDLVQCAMCAACLGACFYCCKEASPGSSQSRPTHTHTTVIHQQPVPGGGYYGAQHPHMANQQYPYAPGGYPQAQPAYPYPPGQSGPQTGYPYAPPYPPPPYQSSQAPGVHGQQGGYY